MPSARAITPIARTLALAMCLAIAHPGRAADLPKPDPAKPAPSLPGSPEALSVPPTNPVAEFRTLLALDPTATAEALARRSESQRLFLNAKLDEYRKLAPQEREARLRTSELHWHLRTLLPLAPTERQRRLQALPEPDRQILGDRLTQWDLLPPGLREELSQNETSLLGFFQLSPPTTTPPQRPTFTSVGDPLQRELDQWQKLPEHERLKRYRRFQTFFELDPVQRARTLAALPEDQRRPTQEVLTALDHLSPADRQRSLDGLARLAGLPPTERARFLENAARWRALSPAEQDRWRKLASRLPPTPPGFGRNPDALTVTNPVRKP